jgi:hypothetical protein
MEGARLRLLMVWLVRLLEVDGSAVGESRRTVGMLFGGRCGSQNMAAVERWVKEKACADGAYWPKLIGQKHYQTCM